MFFFRIELSSFDEEKKSLFIVPDMQDADENGIPVFSEKILTAQADYRQFVKDTKTSIVDVNYVLYKVVDTGVDAISEEKFAELLSADKLEQIDNNSFSISSGARGGKSGKKGDNTKMFIIIGAVILAIIVLLILSAVKKNSDADKDLNNGSSETSDTSSSELSESSDDTSSSSEQSGTETTDSETSTSSEYVDNPTESSEPGITDEPPQDTDNNGYTDSGYSSGGYSSGGAVQSEYTISFHANGGEGELAEIKSAPGQYVVLPSAEEASKTLTRKGYKLIGFSDNTEINYPLYDYKMPTGDVTLFAVWETAEFTVKYNSNGGTGQLSSVKVKYGDNIPLPIDIAVYKDGLNLIGWNTAQNAKTAMNNMKMPAENVTVYAVWSTQKPTSKITFHYDDSVMVRDEEIGSVLNMRQDFGLKKDGYFISGWYLKDNPVPVDFLQITGDCDVYGQWERAAYITITIDQSYLDKAPLSYKVPLDMNGEATLKLPKINDRSSAYNSVYGCTYGYSTKKLAAEFGTIEYFGDTECKFRKDTTLYRVLNKYGGGDGSENNPYVIDYYDQLLYLAENGASGYFIQTADIKFPVNVTREPISTVKIARGYEDKNYNLFTYDGQNFSIRNMRGSGGLFGTLAASTIKNVIIDGANISPVSGNSGILVDEIASYSFPSASDPGATFSTGNSLIQNCRVSNSLISSDASAENAGGICGYGGNIERCIVENTSIYGGKAAGGIVGNACTVKGCISRGNSIERSENSGGIAGSAFGVELHDYGGKIRKVGGEIIGCGSISFTSTEADVCGGIVGITCGISGDAYIRSCYAANMYLNGKQNGSISGGDSSFSYPHSISYCIADSTNKYPSIGGDAPRSRAVRMVISAPQDGIKVEGVLSVLNSSGSGYNQWKIDKNVNGGYPYPAGTD